MADLAGYLDGKSCQNQWDTGIPVSAWSSSFALSPNSLPGSGSPAQAGGTFPRPAVSCVSWLSNIPSRAAPGKCGKGNGCSLDLGTKEWAKHSKWVKHSCAEAGASLEYGAWSGN